VLMSTLTPAIHVHINFSSLGRLGYDWFGFHKKHTGTRYAKLLFLHAVGFAGHVVHFGGPGRQTSMHYFLCLGGTGTVSIERASGHVTPNLYFCIRWDLWVT
jgi:hypothetical protein